MVNKKEWVRGQIYRVNTSTLQIETLIAKSVTYVCEVEGKDVRVQSERGWAPTALQAMHAFFELHPESIETIRIAVIEVLERANAKLTYEDLANGTGLSREVLVGFLNHHKPENVERGKNGPFVVFWLAGKEFQAVPKPPKSPKPPKTPKVLEGFKNGVIFEVLAGETELTSTELFDICCRKPGLNISYGNFRKLLLYLEFEGLLTHKEGEIGRFKQPVWVWSLANTPSK